MDHRLPWNYTPWLLFTLLCKLTMWMMQQILAQCCCWVAAIECACASVDSGGLNEFPCSTCFLTSFQVFIKLFSFHPFHLFVVYAHMTS